jgi:hypothetical protein
MWWHDDAAQLLTCQRSITASGAVGVAVEAESSIPLRGHRCRDQCVRSSLSALFFRVCTNLSTLRKAIDLRVGAPSALFPVSRISMPETSRRFREVGSATWNDYGLATRSGSQVHGTPIPGPGGAAVLGAMMILTPTRRRQ